MAVFVAFYVDEGTVMTCGLDSVVKKFAVTPTKGAGIK